MRNETESRKQMAKEIGIRSEVLARVHRPRRRRRLRTKRDGETEESNQTSVSKEYEW